MRYLSIGEPLIEFTSKHEEPSTYHRRAGGDTLNTAIYLARLLGPDQVGYLTCLGDDPQSRWLIDLIASEGIDISAIRTLPGARPGLYFVTTDMRGERSFTYWRDQAPVRDMFNDAQDAPLDALKHADTLFLSAITLAVLRPEGREHLLEGLARRKANGARVVFDTNYRPILWSDAETAQQVIGRAAEISSLLLPSLDDMEACFGTKSADEAIARLTAMTDAEIAMTTGGEAVLHRPAGTTEVQSFPLPPAVQAVDTTGAGDSFNAAFIVGRDQGLDVASSIAAAASLASVVVGYPGATISASAMPDPFVARAGQPPHI